jgi:prophage regulatory protein
VFQGATYQAVALLRFERGSSLKEPSMHAGFLRLPHIIGDAKKGIPPRIPVSRSTWYAGIEAGRYPKPIRLSEGVSVWRTSDIDALCHQIEQHAGDTK